MQLLGGFLRLNAGSDGIDGSSGPIKEVEDGWMPAKVGERCGARREVDWAVSGEAESDESASSVGRGMFDFDGSTIT